jgi:hypothetical protein
VAVLLQHLLLPVALMVLIRFLVARLQLAVEAVVQEVVEVLIMGQVAVLAAVEHLVVEMGVLVLLDREIMVVMPEV